MKTTKSTAAVTGKSLGSISCSATKAVLMAKAKIPVSC